MLLLHVTGLARADLYASPDRRLTLDETAAYDAAVARRLACEPIQYITGEQEFYGLAIRVSPAVLIPRPETEILVESVLAELARPPGDPDVDSRKAPRPAQRAILDIGTGSGAVAIALARHLPHAHFTATDISAAALAIAAENAARHNLSARIRFVQSDLLDSLNPVILSDGRDAAGVEGPARSKAKPGRMGPAVASAAFDAIVSNPPYVSTADRNTLHPQVRDHEPGGALFAGPDGLNIYRRLIPQAYAALKPNGLLALEIGHGQRDAIASLFAGWNSVRFLNDLQQIPRVVLARRP